MDTGERENRRSSQSNRRSDSGGKEFDSRVLFVSYLSCCIPTQCPDAHLARPLSASINEHDFAAQRRRTRSSSRFFYCFLSSLDIALDGYVLISLSFWSMIKVYIIRFVSYPLLPPFLISHFLSPSVVHCSFSRSLQFLLDSIRDLCSNARNRRSRLTSSLRSLRND